MKTATFVTILAAAAAGNAAVAPNIEERWCNQPGQPCDVSKRVADAFASVISEIKPDSNPRALPIDGPTGMSIRGLDTLSGVVASGQADPRGFVDSFNTTGWDYVWTKAFADLQRQKQGLHFGRSAEASAEAEACNAEGKPCWTVKRAAAAVIDTIEQSDKRTPGPSPQWCRLFGISCGYKRDANPDPQWCRLFGISCGYKRDAEAVADPEANPQWCRLFGISCGYKRDAEAVAEAAPSPQWCNLFGISCGYKRDDIVTRCHLPGGACANAHRDLLAMRHAAHEVLENLPQ